jgi:hypothetical protein
MCQCKAGLLTPKVQLYVAHPGYIVLQYFGLLLSFARSFYQALFLHFSHSLSYLDDWLSIARIWWPTSVPIWPSEYVEYSLLTDLDTTYLNRDHLRGFQH